jgi:phage terminase large subunit
MCSGPAETGKTVAAVLKCHAIAGSVPGAQGAIVRKTYNSLNGTVIKTFMRIINPAVRGIVVYGGANNPERFLYPNGSVIWTGGMDNAGRVLSSERDFIYVNQAEELSIDDWEVLLTRCTGRGAVVEHAQLFGDCNPSGSLHWIRKRKSLRLLTTVHRDNPSLYTPEGELTEQGRRSMAALENLTGVRRKRLLDGIWATAEGAVYDVFDPSIHVCVRNPAEMKRWFLAIDEGYSNPAVILLIGEDSDGRHHCFREYYKRNVLQADFVSEAKLRFLNPVGFITGNQEQKSRCDNSAVDEAAAGLIADLNNSGVYAQAAKGRVLDGINLVQNRLKIQGDGRPRYTVDPSCVNHINEFESYAWKPEKDVPQKENDHSLDAYRYLLDCLREGTGAFGGSDELSAPARGNLGQESPVEFAAIGDGFFG